MLLAAGGMSTNDIYKKIATALKNNMRIEWENAERWIDFVHISCIRLK